MLLRSTTSTEVYTTTYAAPTYYAPTAYTEAPYYTTAAPVYYTEAPYYTTKTAAPRQLRLVVLCRSYFSAVKEDRSFLLRYTE